jgi:hypothetical protein
MKQAAKKRIRKPVTLTLPPHVREMGDALALKNDESLSQLITRLIRHEAMKTPLADALSDIEVIKNHLSARKEIVFSAARLREQGISLLISYNDESYEKFFEALKTFVAMAKVRVLDAAEDDNGHIRTASDLPLRSGIGKKSATESLDAAKGIADLRAKLKRAPLRAENKNTVTA